MVGKQLNLKNILEIRKIKWRPENNWQSLKQMKVWKRLVSKNNAIEKQMKIVPGTFLVIFVTSSYWKLVKYLSNIYL